MKKEKTDQDINKKRGERLRTCRKLRGKTLAELSKETDYTDSYISQMESGSKPIDWDKAKIFAEKLNVSAAFIMLETDVMLSKHSQYTIDFDKFGNVDRSLVEFLISMGYELYFYVVKLYDGRMPAEIKGSPAFVGRDGDDKPYDWDSLNIRASLDQLQEFCLSDSKCKYVGEDGSLSEAVIKRVVINGVALSYGSFVFTLNRLIDYVKFTVDHLKDFQFDFNICDAMQSSIENEIQESRLRIGGVTDISDIAFLTGQNPQDSQCIIRTLDGREMTLAEYMKSDLHQEVVEFNNKIKSKHE